MLNAIRAHLQTHRGDVYIPMLICLMLFLFITVIVFSIATSVTNKLWLDEKLTELEQTVSATGCVKGETLSAIEKEITDRFGGTITYKANFVDDDETKGLVQLNERVVIQYQSDKYVACSIAGFEVATNIDLEKIAVSCVYYKTNDSAID